MTLAPPPSPSDAPSSTFKLAAILGLDVAVPGIALVAVSVADALAHASQRVLAVVAAVRRRRAP